MNDDPDRAQILRRRAVFMSSALAALGCSGGAPPGKVAPVPPVVAVPAPVQAADAGVEAPPKREARSEPDMPSYDVPDGVSDEARERFEQLFSQVREAHALLERLENALPAGCALTDPACDARWRGIADGLLDHDEALRFMQPVCPGSSQAAKLWEERSRAHRDYLAKRRGRLERRIVDIVKTEAERARWDQHQEEANMARPQICLSFACPDW